MTKLTISDLKNDIRLAWVLTKITGFPSSREDLDSLSSMEDYESFLNDSLMLPMGATIVSYEEVIDDYEPEELDLIELDYSGLGYSENLMSVIDNYKNISESFAEVIVEGLEKPYYIGESDVILSIALMESEDNNKIIKVLNRFNDKELGDLIKFYVDVTLDKNNAL